MIIKNWTRTVALALGLSASFAACPVFAEQKLTLLTWNAPQNEPMFRAWMDSFKETHPDVEFEWLDKTGGDWATFYQSQLVAGTPPDIINVQGTLWAEYAANDYIVDLTPYLEKEPEVRDRFAEQILDYWTLDDKVYGIPYYVNKSLLFYNKILFEKAQISAPPETVEELLEQAEKIAALSDETTGFVTLNFDWLYWPLFASQGVEMYSPDGTEAAFNTPNTVKVLTHLAELTKSGAINGIAWTGRWREPNSALPQERWACIRPMGAHTTIFGQWVTGSTVTL